MRVRIGVTDWDWYMFLSQQGATEVNFWQPSGGPRPTLPSGSPFLFKSKYPRGNRIVGGGFYEGWARLPLTSAWEIFGPANGTSDCGKLRQLITRYRERNAGGPVTSGGDPEIGCIMLRDVRFLPPGNSLPAPPDWPKNAVTGKEYDSAKPDHSYLEALMQQLFSLDIQSPIEVADIPASVPGAVFGDHRLSRRRLGQGAFRALVQESYGRRCAITGDKVLPVLQAAHIRPVSASGENRVDNGLLLRSDVHTLFDRGYLSIHPERRTLEVSPRLRLDWGNGDLFYQRQASGVPIADPRRPADRPNDEFLTWHRDMLFIAS